MDILLLQTDIEWQSPDKNRKHIEDIVDSSPLADIIILPEMFTTGFCTLPVDVAEKADTDTLAWMQHLAGAKKAAIAGSIVVEENGKYYNRFYFVKPCGNYSVYNKRHLFSFAGEDREYTAGDERVIVEYCGCRILLQVCYDIRFPVFSRNRDDYDMIIYVANWPVQRIGAWTALLPARAIENQCYVAGVNRTGSDPVAKYSGGTVLIDFFGRPAVSAGFDREEAVLGTVNIQSIKNFRKKFPAIDDADQFTLEYH
ncbi:MAG: nitrilase family protein [Prevotellaceae bacterium]|jgi:predicted amidohydrolase|nr:nitrilase family protein [Prevotellaceae bacterium]